MQRALGSVVQEEEGSQMCESCRSLLQLSPTRRAYLITVLPEIRSAVLLAVGILWKEISDGEQREMSTSWVPPP